ncbi:hypothetical protein MATL_G00097580 [Megalops atlanticus]|uniref:Uncharacterized protein n=1 Tax=Megalops atlanticus TaxID=7932 RepID=A0A9D3T6L6_MEGAT|nr:hypothetical protein MATL_G00097580 [Megalops atlanticus]
MQHFINMQEEQETAPSTNQPVRWMKRDNDRNIIHGRPRSSRKQTAAHSHSQSQKTSGAHARASETSSEVTFFPSDTAGVFPSRATALPAIASHNLFVERVLTQCVCLVPMEMPKNICSCPPGLLNVNTGKSVAVVTMNGRYDLSLSEMKCES